MDHTGHVNALVSHLFSKAPESFPLHLPCSLASWVASDEVVKTGRWVSGLEMLGNVLLARDYVLTRNHDAAKLLETFKRDFNPVKLESGRVLIHNPFGGEESWLADNMVCAIAFVLATYW